MAPLTSHKHAWRQIAKSFIGGRRFTTWRCFVCGEIETFEEEIG